MSSDQPQGHPACLVVLIACCRIFCLQLELKTVPEVFSTVECP